MQPSGLEEHFESRGGVELASVRLPGGQSDVEGFVHAPFGVGDTTGGEQSSGLAEQEEPAVDRLAALRYGLLAIAVYAIFEYLHVPLSSLVLGLCALGAATTAASVWEILVPEK